MAMFDKEIVLDRKYIVRDSRGHHVAAIVKEKIDGKIIVLNLRTGNRMTVKPVQFHRKVEECPNNISHPSWRNIPTPNWTQVETDGPQIPDSAFETDC